MRKRVVAVVNLDAIWKPIGKSIKSPFSSPLEPRLEENNSRGGGLVLLTQFVSDLDQKLSSDVTIKGRISNLKPGKYDILLYNQRDSEKNCSDAREVFNPSTVSI